MARPKRQERQTDLRRQEILDAALRVFARTGVKGASMQQIAKEAGYGTSSLYEYFPGKQAIVRGVLEAVADASEALFDVYVPEGLTFRQRLELLLHHQFAWAEEHRAKFLFLFGQDVLQSPAAHEPDVLDAQIHRMAKWLSANLPEQAQTDPVLLATALTGMAQGFFLQWLREGADARFRDRVPVVIDLFLHGALGASGATQAT